MRAPESPFERYMSKRILFFAHVIRLNLAVHLLFQACAVEKA